MTLINIDTKLADAIHRNYLLIPVINRFGIRLGFGDKSIKTICKEHQIDPEFFTAILNTFTFENYFSEKKLKAFPILQIVDYLRKTHTYYRDVQLKVIDFNINYLIESCPAPNNHLQLIRKFFSEYERELLAHLRREDENTFPYIQKLIEIQQKEDKEQLFKELSKKYSIKVFEREHDNVDEKLFDLKNILIKYLHGDYDQVYCNAVIFELFRLEKDLVEHTRLEDKILIPMVEEIELNLTGKANDKK